MLSKGKGGGGLLDMAQAVGYLTESVGGLVNGPPITFRFFTKNTFTAQYIFWLSLFLVTQKSSLWRI